MAKLRISSESLRNSMILAKTSLDPTLDSIIYSMGSKVDFSISKRVKNILLTYAGLFTELTKQNDQGNFSEIINGRIASEYLTSKKVPEILDVSLTDSFLISSIKSLRETFWSSPLKDVENHFAKLNYTLDELIFKNNLVIPDCEIEGKPLRLRNNSFKTLNSKIKPLENYYFDVVSRSEIIDSSSTLDELETVVDLLLHYSVSENKNLFDFNQFILLDGVPGTGKTLRAKYLLSYAQTKAVKNNLSLNVVQMSFEDRWQNGPLENVKFQLETIASGDAIYLVFVDELDLKFPSRGHGSNSQDQVLGELLKFRGGVYPNKNNYLFLATTNNFKSIDPALTSVFKRYVINSFNTLSEKTALLKLQLKDFSTTNINWSYLESALKDERITGRSIYKIGLEVKTKYSSLAKQIPYCLSVKEKEDLFVDLVNKNDLSTDYLFSVIKNEFGD